MIDKLRSNEAIVCVIGLGYVGLPLAEAFSKYMRVIGFDIDRSRMKMLGQSNNNPNFTITDSAQDIAKADFTIICVPTPITRSKEPDLSYVRDAARLVGQNMKKGSVVILESTVYPGVTEETVRPVLEEESGLKCGEGFKIAYSPERINPGDEDHTIERVTKVVAGMDEATTEIVAQLYSKVAPTIFQAKDIKTAESAKIIENVQRDLNIALMNELAMIFERLGLNMKDVLAVAATKWNFHKFYPGLVGGHCIPVDPYYLVSKAKELGYHPQVILSGRAVNDYMPKHVAEMTLKALNNVGKVMKGSKVLIMGLTYKKDVADTRESAAKEIIRELREYGIEVLGYDPLLEDIEAEFDVQAVTSLEQAPKIDCVLLAVAHGAFTGITLEELKAAMNDRPILIDVAGVLDGARAEEEGLYYRTL